MVLNLWPPLLLHVVEACRVDDAKADQENVGLRVAEGSKTIILLLTYNDSFG
jgi:hypothetical protein